MASAMRSPSLRISEFLAQNDDLQGECCGFLIRPRVDSYGRIRISVVLPADSESLEPSSKRTWRRLLSTWQERAKAYNQKTGATGSYLARLLDQLPADLVRWIALKQQDLEDKEDDPVSYQDLCNMLNRSIFDLLQRAFELQNDDDEMWRSIGQQELKAAQEIMDFFNTPKDEQEELIADVGQRYKKELPLFDVMTKNHRRLRKPRAEKPITRDAVIAKLRHLKKLHPSITSKL